GSARRAPARRARWEELPRDCRHRRCPAVCFAVGGAVRRRRARRRSETRIGFPVGRAIDTAGLLWHTRRPMNAVCSVRLRIWARSMLGRVGARRLSRVLGLALTTWLLAVSAPAQAAGENLLEGRQPTRVQEVRNARVLTDGVRARDGDEWNTNLTAVFANGRAFVEYDLGRSTSIVAAYLQGDNNDRYIVSVSEDGKRFRELWSAPPHDRPGLQARHSSSLRGSGRYVRISAREGDGAYSLSEVQLFAERPSVFPPELRAESGTAL